MSDGSARSEASVSCQLLSNGYCHSVRENKLPTDQPKVAPLLHICNPYWDQQVIGWVVKSMSIAMPHVGQHGVGGSTLHFGQ